MGDTLLFYLHSKHFIDLCSPPRDKGPKGHAIETHKLRKMEKTTIYTQLYIEKKSYGRLHRHLPFIHMVSLDFGHVPAIPMSLYQTWKLL